MVGWKMRTSGREVVVVVEVEEGEAVAVAVEEGEAVAAAAGTTAEKGVVVEEVITKAIGVVEDIVTAVVIKTMGMVVAAVAAVADGDHVDKDTSVAPYRANAYITRIVYLR